MAAVLDSRSEVETLVLDHRGLARHLAHRYARAADQREDLEQVAYVGLVKAAQRFDRDRGVAFTTFATPTILGELRRYCRDTRWAAHVPRPVQEHVQALRRFEDGYVGRRGRSPSTSEAAEALGWTHEQVLEARIAAGCLRPQSLNAVLRASDGTVGEAIDCLGAEDAAFAQSERRDALRRGLSHLTEPERRALRMRAELGCSAPEIGRCLHLSSSQASRLVARAAARLRGALSAAT